MFIISYDSYHQLNEGGIIPTVTYKKVRHTVVKTFSKLMKNTIRI